MLPSTLNPPHFNEKGQPREQGCPMASSLHLPSIPSLQKGALLGHGAKGGELSPGSLAKPRCAWSHYKALGGWGGGSSFLFSIIPRPGGHAGLSLECLWLWLGVFPLQD